MECIASSTLLSHPIEANGEGVSLRRARSAICDGKELIWGDTDDCALRAAINLRERRPSLNQRVFKSDLKYLLSSSVQPINLFRFSLLAANVPSEFFTYLKSISALIALPIPLG